MSSTAQIRRRNDSRAALVVELPNAHLTPLYWATVAVALLATTPGLINFIALDVARPTIGDSLGVSAAEASWATLLGNGAVPLGLVVGATLIRYLPLRRLTLTGLGLQALGAVCSALSANLPMLLLAHAVQGFACGAVTSAIVLSMLVASTPQRQPITVTVLGIALFGAATLGPVVGGIVEQADTWRGLLVLEALLALVAIMAARAAVPNAIVSQKSQVGLATFLVAAAGLGALFIGIAELSWYHWTRPEVETPVVLGAVALLALMIGEWARGGPLATLRYAAVAKICSVAAFSFGGLLGLLLEFLQQIRGLGALDAGMLLWPAPVAAFVGLVWVGAVFSRPRWIMSLAAAGVLLLALAAWQLMTFTEYTGDSDVMQLAALLGLGAGISVSPAILLGTFSVGRDLVGRAVALLTFTPYVMLAASAPVLTYISTVRQTIHYTNLQWQQGWKEAVNATDATGPTAHVLQTRALVLGINDAAVLVVLACLVVLAVVAVLVRFGTPSTNAHADR